MGAQVVVAGPATMMPRDIDQMGVRTYTKLEDAIADADVVMMLRIQLEREKQNIFPSLREYAQHYCLNRTNIKLAKPDAIVMHPGPMNRGVEISPDIADDPSYSVILDQVNNGVAVRMGRRRRCRRGRRRSARPRRGRERGRSRGGDATVPRVSIIRTPPWASPSSNAEGSAITWTSSTASSIASVSAWMLEQYDHGSPATSPAPVNASSSKIAG